MVPRPFDRSDLIGAGAGQLHCRRSRWWAGAYIVSGSQPHFGHTKDINRSFLDQYPGCLPAQGRAVHSLILWAGKPIDDAGPAYLHRSVWLRWRVLCNPG